MRRDIEFKSGGETVRGWLYTPERGNGPFPVVVMAGGWCYVKELVQPHVAQQFADTGLAAILFDYRNFGSSDGTRRQHIDPNAQLEDYRNAISFAETLDEVDSARIGVWGLSYSGGHALILGATDPRVKCVSAQIPVVDGFRNMRRVHGTIGFRRFEQLLLDDRRARFGSGEDGFLPHATADPASEVSTWPFRDLRDVPRSEAARGPGLREQKHDRIRRAADVVQRRAVPATPARRPDAGDRRREGRSHAVGSGDRGVQRHPDCEEAARRHRRLDPHDALQRSIAARAGGRRSRRVVCPAPVGRCRRSASRPRAIPREALRHRP